MLKPHFSHGSVRRNAHHLPQSLQGVGWGGVGIVTFLRPRSCDLAQDVDATLTWSGVGMLTFLRPRSRNLAQDVDASSHGWGGMGMLTFLRPRSLDLAQDVDATLTRGGHMMGLHLDRHKHEFIYIDILSDDVDVDVVVVVDDDDDDPVELFQTRGKCWELIAMLPGPQAPQAPQAPATSPGRCSTSRWRQVFARYYLCADSS